MNIIVNSDFQDSDFLHEFFYLTKSSGTFATFTDDDLLTHGF